MTLSADGANVKKVTPWEVTRALFVCLLLRVLAKLGLFLWLVACLYLVTGRIRHPSGGALQY